VRDQRIIHCDIKPENILLDTQMSAKVADFGLSRIMRREQTRTMTMNLRGTCGYMAPEWTSPHTPITVKIDVYSYGMVLLEIVSGRRNLKTSCIVLDAPDFYYPQWAFEKLVDELETDASILELVDPSLTGLVDVKEVRRALLVAFWCIHHKPEHRPTMSKVVQMLEGDIPIQQPVPRPGILDEMHPGSHIRGQGSSNLFESSDPVSTTDSSHSALHIRRYSTPSSPVASHDSSTKNPTFIEPEGQLSSSGSTFNGR
jgi:serine/threonine protein kinase